LCDNIGNGDAKMVTVVWADYRPMVRPALPPARALLRKPKRLIKSRDSVIFWDGMDMRDYIDYNF